MREKRALIAMSGGVDSSAAALLMQREGYTCIGATMRLFSSEADCTEDARAVASQLGMEFHALNLEAEFSREVIDRFVRTYERGETPNPCIACNRYMKFGALLRIADELECECIVTGHYARVEREKTGRFLLKTAADPSKDQSYVLYHLTQAQLARVRFPLGGLSKPEVRALAEESGIRTAHKQESQDICFVPDGDYAGFIERRTGQKAAPGNFVLEDGTVIGRHKGLICYTVGQRKGLGIAWEHPLYVLRKDAGRNEVVLSDHAALFSKRLTARNFNWIALDPPEAPLRCTARTRYQARETSCTVTALPDGSAEVAFDEPVRAVTPGQAVVLYDGDTVLGGGTIMQTVQEVSLCPD